MLKIHYVCARLSSIIPALLIGAACTTSAQTLPTASLTGTINTTNAYHDGSYNYIVSQDFGTPPDTGLAPTISQLRIFENGTELGPPHTRHADIRNVGMGRFSHWGGSAGTGGSNLYFSASDNSDPRTNGRNYTYQIGFQQLLAPPPTPPPPPSPISLAIGISVPAGSTLPASDTTTVVINFISGTPTSVTLARGSLTAFAQWPTGTLSQYFTRTASGLTFDLCLAPNCVPSGPLTLKATAIDATGQSASASTDVMIGSTTPPPPPPLPPPPPPPGPTLKTDLGVYYEPALPAMGSAGSQIVDPTFGTTILRVTDPTTGSDCRTPYSYYPNFNSNTRRFYVQCGNAGVFYTFDAATFTVANGRKASSPPTGSALWYGMVWSGFDPDIIYIQGLTDLWAYNPGTDTYTHVHSFAAEVQAVGAAYLEQMSMSRDDDVFAFSYGMGGGPHFGYVVWQRSTNQVLLNKLDPQADEVHLDKSGRYLNVVTVRGEPQIWDLQTGTMTQLGSYAGGDGYFHYDTGDGTIFTAAGSGSALAYRAMATPSNVTAILPGYFGMANMNYSMNADNERWALVWVQRNDTLSITMPFENELLQVATDGSGRVRRIAHHRSQWDDYYDQPNANISRDGQFVAFTSNWGNASGRRDVYIVQIPPAPTN